MQIVRFQMLPHRGHIGCARRKFRLVLFDRQKMMVVRRAAVVHLADRFIKVGFVVLCQPQSNGNLLGLVFSSKNLSIGWHATSRLRKPGSRNQQNRKTGKQYGRYDPTSILGHISEISW